MPLVIRNATRGAVLADRAERADSFWPRLKGLLGRSELPAGEGLEITGCNGIHMWFMRFPIDVLFVDDAGRVIRAVHTIKPWRMTRFYSAATRAIELPAGTLARTGTAEGDVVEVVGPPEQGAR